MSKQIDERIVEMRFDNSKFEKNVSTTMKTLDKLKEKLAFKNASDGFKSIQKASEGVSFDHLVKTIDNLNSKIADRGNIITKTVDNIKEKIASSITEIETKIAGMIKQVTIDPISTGFEEYNLKVNSVQTIAANTGVLLRDALGGMNVSAEAITNTGSALEKAWDIWLNGAYGNGATRIEALGDEYSTVQDYINQIASGQLTMKDSVESATEALEEQVYTMQDIEQVLDELNLYADRTIYNYAQMTDTIGALTVAGVDLYDSKTVVEGMANYAAFVGADASQAAHIMKRAATSLTTGYLSLHDWISFESTAGFASKEFQEKLIDMAQHMYDNDEAYHEYLTARAGEVESIRKMVYEDSHRGGQGFRYSLTDTQWLSTEVFVNTMHEFANDWNDEMYEALGYTKEEIAELQAFGQVAYEAATKSKTFKQMWDAVTEAAQSSWTTSWEYIVGHFYDARTLWTAVGDELSSIIDGMNTARNDALKFWASNPLGRKRTLEGFAIIWRYLKNLFGAMSIEWRKAFKAIDGKILVRLSNRFYNFSKTLKGQKINYQIGTIANIFGILVDVLGHVSNIIKSAGKVFINFFTGIIDSIDVQKLYFATKNIREFINNLLDMSKIDARVGASFAKILEPFYKLLSAPDINRLAADFEHIIYIIVAALELLWKVAKAAGIVIITTLKYILDMFGLSFTLDDVESILATADAFIVLADSMLDLEALPGRVTSALDKFFSFIKKIPIYILTAAVAGVIGLNEIIKKYIGIDVLAMLKTFYDNTRQLIEKIKESWASFMEQMNSAPTLIDKLKVVFSTLAGYFKILFSGITDFLGPIGEKIKEYSEFLLTKNNIQRLTQLAVLFARLYLLIKTANSTKAITTIADGIKKFIDVTIKGTKGAFDGLTDMFSAISKNANAQLIFSIAAAVLALAIAVSVISAIPSEKMEGVLTTLTLIFSGMIALFGSLKGMLAGVPEKAAVSIGSIMIGIGAALLMLAIATKIMASIDMDAMITAVIGMAVLIGALSLLVKAFAHTKRAKYAIQAAVGLNLVVQAIFPLIAAIGLIMGLLYLEGDNKEFTTALTVLGVLILFVIGIMEFLVLAASSIDSKKALAGLFVMGFAVSALVGSLFLLIASIGLIMGLLYLEGDNKEFTIALMVMGILIFFIVGVMAFLVMAADGIDSKKALAGLFVMGVSVSSLIGSLFLLIAAIGLIMGLLYLEGDNKEFTTALTVLGVLILFVIGIMEFLVLAASSIDSKKALAGLVVIGIGVILIAASIGVIISAINKLMKIFETMDLSTDTGVQQFKALMAIFLAVVVVVAIFMAGLIGAAALIDDNKGTLKIIGTAIAIVAIAKAIDLIAGALLKLTTIDYNDQKFISAIKILGAIMLAVLVIGAIMALIFGRTQLLSNNRFNFSFAPNMFNGWNRVTRIQGGIGNIGNLLQGIGIGILAVIAALWIVMDIFGKLIDLSNKWDSENGKEKLLQVIKDLCEVFVEAEPYVTSAAETFGNVLTAFLKGLLNNLLDLLKSVVQTLVIGVSYIVSGLVDIIIGLINGLAGTDLSKWYEIDWLGDTENGLEEAMVEFLSEAQDAPINRIIDHLVALLALIIYGVGNAILNSTPQLAIAIFYLIGALGYLASYIAGAIFSMFMPEYSPELFNEYMSDFSTNFVDGWKTTWDTVIKPGLTKIYKFIAGWLWSAVLFILYTPLAAIDFVINDFIIGTINGVINSINKAWRKSIPLLEEIPIIDAIDGVLNEAMKDAGIEIVDFEDEIAETSSEALDNITNTLTQVQESMSGIGSSPEIKVRPNLVVDGINTDDLNKNVYDFSKKAGEQSVQAAKDSWDINSPSEEAKDIATDVGKGFINGITEYINSPEAQTAINSFKENTIGGLYGEIPSFLDFSNAEVDGSIQEIVQLQYDSEDSDTAGALTSLMSQYTEQSEGTNMTLSDMASQLGITSSGISDMTGFMQTSNDTLISENGKFYDDSEVVNELSGLRDDMSKLATAMTKIQMRLDSNALVGQLVGPLDEALARRAVRSNRGN